MWWASMLNKEHNVNQSLDHGQLPCPKRERQLLHVGSTCAVTHMVHVRVTTMASQPADDWGLLGHSKGV
jgi:hypothetical protein